jgi:hypothetical protein
MRLNLNICTLLLLAGLIGSVIACSEGSTTPAGDGDGEGGGTSATAGGTSGTTTTTATGSTGGASATTTSTAEGGATTTTAFDKCFDFAESTEDWKKNYASVFTLADKTKRDEAAATALLGDSTAEWVEGPGYGQKTGFVQLTIPFATTQVEYQGLLYSYLPTTGLELAGKTIHAYVKLVSGMTADDASKPSGAKLVVKSGPDWFYGDGGWVNLSKGEWTHLMLTVNSPALDQARDPLLYDPNDIREISVEVDTSGSATTVATPGILMIDHICY